MHQLSLVMHEWFALDPSTSIMVTPVDLPCTVPTMQPQATPPNPIGVLLLVIQLVNVYVSLAKSGQRGTTTQEIERSSLKPSLEAYGP